MSAPSVAVEFTAPLQALADAGLLVQVTAAIVLWLLFHVVRRQGNERRYFRLWTTAWGCFALAFAALAFRYRLITGTAFEAYLAHENSPLVLGMYSLYQISKLCGVGLLIAGVLSFNGIAHPRWKVWAPLLGLYGLVTVLIPPFFERSLALQDRKSVV